MKVLVTGAKGFIGKNLCLALKNRGHEVFEYDIGSSEQDLKDDVVKADFIVHLAGANRPKDSNDFKTVNVDLTRKLIDVITEQKSEAPLLLASSVQAERDNAYGQSKALAESLVNNFGFNGHDVYVYRLCNVFGKWCRPNYNSVIATFCYNMANNIPLVINDKAPAIEFVYIDDVANEFIRTIENHPTPTNCILAVEPTYLERLPDIVALLASFKASRDTLLIPEQTSFQKKLYSTYLSYLPDYAMSYPLITHADQRGSFTEMLKTENSGQVSVNVIKPGTVKGNHYHMTKTEKYLVVSGTCEIKLRNILEGKPVSYVCSDKKPEVVDIIPGYTHSIKNIGISDAIVIMWASELFDPDHGDTYPLAVEPEDEK